MGKVYLICGKICSGKSYYAKSLKEKYNAEERIEEVENTK